MTTYKTHKFFKFCYIPFFVDTDSIGSHKHDFPRVPYGGKPGKVPSANAKAIVLNPSY